MRLRPDHSRLRGAPLSVTRQLTVESPPSIPPRQANTSQRACGHRAIVAQFQTCMGQRQFMQEALKLSVHDCSMRHRGGRSAHTFSSDEGARNTNSSWRPVLTLPGDTRAANRQTAKKTDTGIKSSACLHSNAAQEDLKKRTIFSQLQRFDLCHLPIPFVVVSALV